MGSTSTASPLSSWPLEPTHPWPSALSHILRRLARVPPRSFSSCRPGNLHCDVCMGPPLGRGEEEGQWEAALPTKDGDQQGGNSGHLVQSSGGLVSQSGLGFHHRLWWTLGGPASGPLPTLHQSSCLREPSPVGPHLRKLPSPPPH